MRSELMGEGIRVFDVLVLNKNRQEITLSNGGVNQHVVGEWTYHLHTAVVVG